MGDHRPAPVRRRVATRPGDARREVRLAEDEVLIRLWGVRGSVPCPGPKTERYGGNTACVEVRLGPPLAVFVGSPGIRGLGLALLTGPPAQADSFLTPFPTGG